MSQDSFRASTRAWLAGVGLALLCMAGIATAATPGEAREQTEASMLLTGTISIAADGGVSGYGIDHKDKVPDSVLASIEKSVLGWRFSPVLVDGQPAPAQAKMSLRMRARPSGEGKFVVSIASASFGDDDAAPTDVVTSITMDPPRYPRDVVRMGGQGVAYLVIRVGRQGTVEDVAVEQVNLTVYASDKQMERFRRSFAKTSADAARDWTFNPPTTGENANDESWAIRVPVTFALGSDEPLAYGQWESYLPGPRQDIPWLKDGEAGNDALANGDVHMMGSGPRLLTPLED
ncbi:MAG: energy transducer TonB [Luteimonas sp.]|nr:energy transducer TonB [Luteimonas sp.]